MRGTSRRTTRRARCVHTLPPPPPRSLLPHPRSRTALLLHPLLPLHYAQGDVREFHAGRMLKLLLIDRATTPPRMYVAIEYRGMRQLRMPNVVGARLKITKAPVQNDMLFLCDHTVKVVRGGDRRATSTAAAPVAIAAAAAAAAPPPPRARGAAARRRGGGAAAAGAAAHPAAAAAPQRSGAAALSVAALSVATNNAVKSFSDTNTLTKRMVRDAVEDALSLPRKFLKKDPTWKVRFQSALEAAIESRPPEEEEAAEDAAPAPLPAAAPRAAPLRPAPHAARRKASVSATASAATTGSGSAARRRRKAPPPSARAPQSAEAAAQSSSPDGDGAPGAKRRRRSTAGAPAPPVAPSTLRRCLAGAAPGVDVRVSATCTSIDSKDLTSRGVLMLELVDVDSRKKSSASASTSASEEVVVVGDAKVRVGEALFTEWSGGVVPAAFVKLAALGKAGRKRDAAAKKQWKSSVKGLQMQMREISTGVWTLTVRASSSSSSSSSSPLVIAMKRES